MTTAYKKRLQIIRLPNEDNIEWRRRYKKELMRLRRVENPENNLRIARKYRLENRDRVRELDREYKKRNASKISARRKQLRLENIEICRAKERTFSKKYNNKKVAYCNSYRKKHPEKYRLSSRHQTAKHRAAKKLALPKWADICLIKEKYKEADAISKATGILHHVDHIIPLRGKNVSGLHIHTNLRPIPYFENCSKGNKLLEELVS